MAMPASGLVLEVCAFKHLFQDIFETSCALKPPEVVEDIFLAEPLFIPIIAFVSMRLPGLVINLPLFLVGKGLVSTA